MIETVNENVTLDDVGDRLTSVCQVSLDELRDSSKRSSLLTDARHAFAHVAYNVLDGYNQLDVALYMNKARGPIWYLLRRRPLNDRTKRIITALEVKL